MSHLKSKMIPPSKAVFLWVKFMTELTIAATGLMATCFLFGAVFGTVFGFVASMFINIAMKHSESRAKPNYIPTPQLRCQPKPKYNPHK